MTCRTNFRVVAAALGLLSGRWVFAILDELSKGPKRHGELLSAVEGLSEKVLTETLRRMERDGLIARTVGSGIPSRVVYRDTPLARSLEGPLRGLLAWQDGNWDAVEASRNRWDNE